VPAYQQDLPRRRVSTLLWRKCLDAGDFGGKSFATNFTDRRIGCRYIAVDHGAADGGQKALGVGLIAILPRDKRTPGQR
jgi:hypothetical protein